MKKPVVSFRADPYIVAKYDKIYGKPSIGMTEIFEPWMTIREIAINILKGKFHKEEIIYTIHLLDKIGFKDKDALRQTILLRDLTNNPFVMEAKFDIVDFLTRLKDLHRFEFYFFFKLCYEFKYSNLSIDEYAESFC